MKRSRHIDLNRMRKAAGRGFFMRPLALGVAAALAGCAQKEEVKVVSSIEDCVSNTSLDEQQCEAAYQKALAEAERTGPKYPGRAQCETEFDSCQRTGSGVWMPLMTGFMIGSMLNNRDYHSGYYNPVYRYSRPHSSYYNRIMTADGTVIGRYGKGSYSVDRSAMKPKPTVTRTVSRGGFGSVASAKSSWGGGRSGGWGG
ncbi:DUF1190 domain-containing protein [Microbulbifer sp.]|uniref:DUF1190 domain-containing protein n=1 Tax=Microbulbifer sp. TaxID=1908541 RepID=UPI003F37875D